MLLLPYEIIHLIFEFLRFDRHTLFSCVLLNRISSKIAISLLWKNPFIIDNNINNYQYATLIRTYFSCFTDVEKTYLKNNSILINNITIPKFDYAFYLEEIIYCESIQNSILYWILLEHRKYTKTQLNSVKDINQFKKSYRYLFNPLINSLYHMLLNNGKIKSLGISITTIKIMNNNDRIYFDSLNISNLSNLTIYLKDSIENEYKENIESFNFILESIIKWCRDIKRIRIFNLLIFTNQQKSLCKIQKIIRVQRKIKKLEFYTPEHNIIINEILSNLKGLKFEYLKEIVLQGTDLSINSRLKGLTSVQSLKSLELCRCKGVSLLNIRILSESSIVLKKLKFIDNEFSLGLVVSTIGKSLKELITNQLDDESTEIIINYSIKTLKKLEVKVNLILTSLKSINCLLKNSKLTHLKVIWFNDSSSQFVKSRICLPKNLIYLGLFSFKGINLEDLKCLLNNCFGLEILEISGIDSYNNIDSLVDYIKLNIPLKSLIIDNNKNLL